MNTTFAEVLDSDPYKPQPSTFDSVFRMWREEGPLVHWPSGIASIDNNTGGGLVFGSRAYLMGAPDAGKTALLIQLAHQCALQGMCVGLLAIDEESSDVVTRFVQRVGWLRTDCETRADQQLDGMRDFFAKLPVRFYDDSFTIESAAEDLAAWATERKCRAFFGVDSIQTALSNAGDLDNPRETITANVRAIRAMSTRHKLLTVATCEMNRQGYRNPAQQEQQDDLAAAKESGAIEYSARVLLSMRTVKDEPGQVQTKIVKNKLGRSRVEFRLQLNHATQSFTEVGIPEYEEQTSDQKKMAQLHEDCIAVYTRLREKQAPIEGGATGFRVFARIMGVRADRVLYKLIEMGIITEAKLGKKRVLEIHHSAIPVSPV